MGTDWIACKCVSNFAVLCFSLCYYTEVVWLCAIPLSSICKVETIGDNVGVYKWEPCIFMIEHYAVACNLGYQHDWSHARMSSCPLIVAMDHLAKNYCFMIPCHWVLYILWPILILIMAQSMDVQYTMKLAHSPIRVRYGMFFVSSKCDLMMMSSKWNIFHVTVPLWREFTIHQWIPFTKASDAELECFLWSTPEQLVNCLSNRLSKQSIWWWFVTPLHSLWRHYNVYPPLVNATSYVVTDYMLSRGYIRRPIIAYSSAHCGRPKHSILLSNDGSIA